LRREAGLLHSQHPHAVIMHEVADCNKTGEAVFSVEVVHVPGAEARGGAGAWGVRRMIELWCTGRSWTLMGGRSLGSAGGIRRVWLISGSGFCVGVTTVIM
jgi:hypothetical protein